MKFGAALLIALLPATAWAQQASTQQQIQGAIDQGTATMTRTISTWGSQIISDQQTIATLTAENAELKKKLAAADGSQKSGEMPKGAPQLGHQ